MKKYILFFLVITCFRCHEKDDRFPSFQPNITLKEGDYVKDLTKGRDFSIAYGHSTDFPDGHSIKVFSQKNGIWEKIEFVRDLSEMDTSFSESDLDLVFMEMTIRKECRKDEGEMFFSELKKNGLFELPEERELLEKCREQRQDKTIPVYDDIGYVNFYIVQGDKARLLSYQTHKRDEDCPGFSEWDKVDRIQQLFEKSWYRKKHY